MDFWDIIYKIGFALCHQLPDRTPVLNGYHLPLCARCTGIYVGVVCGYLYLLVMRKLRVGVLPRSPFGFIIVGLIGLTFLDALTTFFLLRPESEYSRILTGLFTGASLPTFAYPLLVGEIKDEVEERSNIDNWCEFGVFITIPLVLFALFYLLPIGAFYVISILSIVGVFLIFSNLFSMLISLIVQPRRPLSYILTVVLTFIVIYLLLTLLYYLHKYSLRFIEV